jgi:hypothetical protein
LLLVGERWSLDLAACAATITLNQCTVSVEFDVILVFTEA